MNQELLFHSYDGHSILNGWQLKQQLGGRLNCSDLHVNHLRSSPSLPRKIITGCTNQHQHCTETQFAIIIKTASTVQRPLFEFLLY